MYQTPILESVAAIFVALAVAISIAELVVFALVAGRIGVLPTIVLLLAVSGVGAWLLVRQGIETWRRLRATIRRRERPTDELADAGLIALAGFLFLTPGFFTDAVAFLVVIPATRRRLRGLLRRGVTAVAVTRFGWGGRAAVVGKKIYDVRATQGSDPVRRPEQLPSSGHPSGEDDSLDKG